MLKKRIIACLDIANEKVVKGVKFRGHKVLGDMVSLALKYSDEGADELVFYDILASPEKRSICPKLVEKIAKVINIPFSVAGGIKTIEHARLVLAAGAEKISVNSMAIENPELISELVDTFGRQAVVVGVDSKLVGDQYQVFQYTGRENTTTKSSFDTNAWLRKVQSLGAGEIVLNTMDHDGTRVGFDINQINQVTKGITIPIIASGGAGEVDDFFEVFSKTKVTGALAAGIFHENKVSLKEVRDWLLKKNIEVRDL